MRYDRDEPRILTDDALLDIPIGNLTPGQLAQSFRAHAAHKQKVDEDVARQVTQHADQQAAQEKEYEEHEALQRREEIVLAQIAEREAALREEMQLLDDRTIKLHDGRRAYVDGDDYRDAEGHKLTGADRAQAEVLHLDQPHAATWQEQHELTERYGELQKMKHNIEDLQAGTAGPNETALLSRYEKQLQPKARQAADYSDTDYMGALGSLSAQPQTKPGPAL